MPFEYEYMSLSQAFQWRHNESHGVSNHRRLHCLINCWYRPRSKKISKLRVTGLCAWNSPVTGEFPTQKASNAENVSIWLRHRGEFHFCQFSYYLLIRKNAHFCFEFFFFKNQACAVACWQVSIYHIGHKINLTKSILRPLKWNDTQQSGRSPKVVALFSATNISSNIVWLFQQHDTIQMKSNYAWINYNHDDIAIRSHIMI